MLLSTKGRYGLRLMVSLGQHYGCGLLGVEALSSLQGISGNYIHLLLGTLRSCGLIRSVRGREGGYELGRSPEKITLLQIITAVEGSNFLVECVKHSDRCSRSTACPTRKVWCKVSAAIEEVLQNMTLQQLLEDSCENEFSPNYSI